MSARRLLLVVPSADDHRQLALARALAEEPTVDLTVLLWFGGPLASEFAALGPTIDAGSVNDWPPTRLLARARLTPAARALKNRRLRSLLAAARPVGAVVVGGLGGVDALGWLAGEADTTVVIVRATSLDGSVAPPVREADLLVATDAQAADWLVNGGVPASRIRRHALLEGAEPTRSTTRSRVGLVGWSAAEVTQILASRVAVDPDTEVTWFVDEQEAWGLWQGPTASPLAGHVRLASPRARADDLAELALLVVGAQVPASTDVAAAATAFATPVVVAGPRDVVAAAAAEPTDVSAEASWTATARIGVQELVGELRGTPTA